MADIREELFVELSLHYVVVHRVLLTGLLVLLSKRPVLINTDNDTVSRTEKEHRFVRYSVRATPITVSVVRLHADKPPCPTVRVIN
jgi:hypothetical protein